MRNIKSVRHAPDLEYSEFGGERCADENSERARIDAYNPRSQGKETVK